VIVVMFLCSWFCGTIDRDSGHRAIQLALWNVCSKRISSSFYELKMLKNRRTPGDKAAKGMKGSNNGLLVQGV